MRRAIFTALALGLAAPALIAQSPAPPAPAPAAAPDPARLAAAERLVGLIMPADLLRRMAGQPIPGIDAVAQTPPEAYGLPADPHFAERMRIQTRVTNEVMIEIMAEWEPETRRMFASFFARQFTLAEIEEMTVFFSTPVGRRYAEVSLTLTEDPVVMEGMRAMVPRFAEMSGRIDERVRAATAHLPAPPEPVDEIVNEVDMSNAQ
jgi:hypothetical protein